MKISELAVLALNSLRYRNLRSWLAILGIVIGVASIISLISISTGLNSQIQSNLGGLGSNVITITPGATRATGGFGGGGEIGGGGGAPRAGAGGSSGSSGTITFHDADALRTTAGVAKLDARIQGNAEVTFRGKNTSVTIIGVEPAAFPADTSVSILYGRTLGSGDLSSVVLGYSVATETFNDSMLNKQIKIKGVPFRVVGILNQSGASFSGPDRDIFISQKAAETLFNQTQKVSSVVVLASSTSSPETVAASLTTKLQQLHRVTNTTQDFTVTTAASLESSLTSVTNTLGIFLGGIASISLIVGGIGVANAMFTSVLEQTKFIGLLKSLGARNKDVLMLFLIESGLVGLVGGLMGIALSFVGSAIVTSFGLPSEITPELIIIGLGFSIVIGSVSGLIPARNAASVAPVEALRYE